MFAVHELGFLATRVDVAICANVMDFCVRRQPTTTTNNNNNNNNNKIYLGTVVHKVNHLFTMKLCIKQ